MANKHKGEVGFTAGDKEYRLRFSADAICNLEEALDKGLNEIGTMLQAQDKWRMSTIRTMFGIAMKDAQPDISDDEIAQTFRSMRAKDALTIVIQAFSLSMVDPDEGGSEAANPPQPSAQANGTGSDYSKSGSTVASTKKPSGEEHPGRSTAN